MSFFRATIILLALLLPLEGQTTQSTLTARADSWYPYNGDPTAQKPGYVIELMRKIYAPHKIIVDYQNVPWTRTIAGVQSGQYDCAVAANKTDAPGCLFPEEPCGNSIFDFLIKSGQKWRYRGVASLRDINLGVVAGYIYPDQELNKYIINNSRDRTKITLITGENPLTVGYACWIRASLMR